MSAAKRFLYWPWIRLAAGCDFRTRQVFHYDQAYSFDRPSCWAPDSTDLSQTISIKAFEETFQVLPVGLRAEVGFILSSVAASPRPRLLLLLFGLTKGLSAEYRKSLERIFSERSKELRGGSLAIKVHPGAIGEEEELFIDWARRTLPTEIVPIRTLVNLEFMLGELDPDYVLAGPCGALPIVQRLGVGRPVVLPEVLKEVSRMFPADSGCFHAMIDGMRVW